MGAIYKTEGEYLFLNVKVIPGAAKTCIGESGGDRLKIRVAAAPEDGKANRELISFLSKTLKVPKQKIEIVFGEKSRNKVLKLPAKAVLCPMFMPDQAAQSGLR